MPKLTDFDQSLQDYKAQVEAEIAQEAADAGMTVEEYAAAGYEAPAQPQETQEQPQQETPEQPTKEPAASDYYYSINEGAARRAKEMNSFSDYKPGSATAEYRHYVDEAFVLAQAQKKRVDPMYHEKIDSLLDTYARKLAANMNHGYEIDARVPSILIAGGSNFPVRKKEKQNAARDSNMQEWQYIQGLLDKIRSTGMGGIRQDDPQAIPKLQKKLAGLEKAQETMKAVNAYYRKHGTLDGCPHLSPENLENLKADMASGWHYEKKPFQSWELSNNNAEIRRVRQRIESLTRANEVAYVGWEFDGGHVEANRDQGRLQVFFDGKPEADARQQLKEHGFRWAPSVGAWQRLLNDNAYYASDRIACIQPLSGIKPTELQHNSSREQREQAAQEQAEPDYFYRVHANPISDSRENLYMLQAYIPQDNGRAKIGDVLYVGTPERCRELMDQLNTGELTQQAVKELYAKEQEQPTPEPTPEQEPAPEPEQEPVPEPETAPAQEQGDTFTIYQLKGGPETRDYRYEAYDSLQEAGLAVDRQNYDLVYTAPLDGKTSLEDIYRTFNADDRPADFRGHSLSVSDVVVLNRGGKEEAHYCDSFGFTPVPEFFLQREKQLAPRELLTGESIQTPRGSFLVTDMSREQLEAAGYGFHHQSEDGKYLIMGNGTDAFAIPAQQESPIKAAEMTTEQNYNMIDGVLNNALTMSELEAKAKAGEQISLFDVAEAAKAEARKPKQPQRPAQKQKKPSIRAQLKAAKEEQQKKSPQREKAQELEV